MGNVTLSGFITVPDSELALIKSELPNHIKLTRQEAGCLSFNVTQSDSDKNRFDVIEIFENREAFENHQNRVKSSYWGQVTTNIERHYAIREGLN